MTDTFTSPNIAFDDQLGASLIPLMHRKDITEIYVNADGYIWYDSHIEGKQKSSIHLSASKVRTIIEMAAGQNGKIVSEKVPSVSCEIAGYGARFQGELPPIVKTPQFNIRKKAIKIFTLDDYVKNGTLSLFYKSYLVNAILKRKNILVVGGTGTGKTTFLNAVLDSISKLTSYHRIISIEDTPELQCAAPDYSAMYTISNVDLKPGEPVYDMTRLLADCMRRSPDRIIVGEVRDGAAYAMLKAFNTGHEGGAATVHANTAEQGLDRIESLCYENPSCAGDVRRLIGEAIDVVVFLSYKVNADGTRSRFIEDIVEVNSYNRNTKDYILHHVTDESNET